MPDHRQHAPMTAQGTCARCQMVIPLGELRIFAGRGLCLPCHGQLVAQSRPPGHPPGTPPLAMVPTWFQLALVLGQARLTLVILRCTLYLTSFAVWGPRDQGGRPSLIAAVLVGAYAADNLTWLAFRIADLPRELAQFPLEVLLTTLCGVGLISWQGLVPLAADSQVIALAFPAFLLVLAGKTLVWGWRRYAPGKTD